MAQSKRLAGLNEPDIKKLLDVGRIETELDYERVMLADRYLRLQEKNQPDLRTTRQTLHKLIIDFETRRWSDRTLITDAQIEESDAAEVQAEEEYAFIRQRRKLILTKLNEFGLRQKELAMLLNHNKSYTSELLNGIRSFSSNDLILIHLLFKIRLEDLFITILSQETLARLNATIDKISASNPKAKSLRSALARSPSETVSQPASLDGETKYRKPRRAKYATAELTLSNK
ncbi:transcriptional regulator [Dyadobacter sp. MSC1_007]|jgi:transcriptional regulator with XRE-family HTH domain|uniref:transcriptional regulator n=1 Tax=Dyadobacter sp. MSC1_007 TaxID=2909264 RepID=UPI0020306907|nr:transcriptional regulator [Dyadobacter sp. MSC1_007]